MKPEETIDFNIRSTWHKIARMYNIQASEYGVSMATGMVLLNIDLKEDSLFYFPKNYNIANDFHYTVRRSQ